MSTQKKPSRLDNFAEFNYRYRYLIAGFLWLLTLLLAWAMLSDRIPWESWSKWGYLGLFLICVLNGATIVFAGPSQVITFLAAKSLPFIAVGFLTGVATALGEVSGSILGRSTSLAFDSSLEKQIKKLRSTRAVDYLLQHTRPTLFLLALIPNPFFDIASITSGAIGIPFGTYFWPISAGKVCRFLLIAAAGKFVLV